MEIKEDFFLVGLQDRTSNAKEMTGQGIIPELWSQIFKENIKAKIPLSQLYSEDIYAAYSNYESNETGPYHFFLGYRVHSFPENLPNPLKSKKVLAGNYQKFGTEKGDSNQTVLALWQKIWNMSSRELGGKRAFKIDFELYRPEKTNDPHNSVVEIFIGLQ